MTSIQQAAFYVGAAIFMAAAIYDLYRAFFPSQRARSGPAPQITFLWASWPMRIAAVLGMLLFGFASMP